MNQSNNVLPGTVEVESRPLVLVVDDHQSVLQTLRFLLESKGYRPLIAPNGETALTLCRQHLGEVSVVITDLMMPGMDGTATIRALRAMDPHLEFIAMSGGADGGDIAELQALGVIAFLYKPFRVDEMLQALRQALEKRAAASQTI